MCDHWTASDLESMQFAIAFDFVNEIQLQMERENISQDDLAKRMDITKDRLSQMMSNPGNLELKSIIKMAAALRMKVSIIPYDDKDPTNTYGPIIAQIFKIIWEKSGRPRDFWDVDAFFGDDSHQNKERD